MTAKERLKLLRSTRVSDHPDVLRAEKELEEERRKLLASTRVSDHPDRRYINRLHAPNDYCI